MVINTTLADVNSDCSLDMSTDELLTDNTTVCHVTVTDRSPVCHVKVIDRSPVCHVTVIDLPCDSNWQVTCLPRDSDWQVGRHAESQDYWHAVTKCLHSRQATESWRHTRSEFNKDTWHLLHCIPRPPKWLSIKSFMLQQTAAVTAQSTHLGYDSADTSA